MLRLEGGTARRLNANETIRTHLVAIRLEEATVSLFEEFFS
jgi:hypothetical protein